MQAGYSTNPLFKKLGLKEGFHVLFIHSPENYGDMIGEMMDKLIVKQKRSNDLNFIHLFTNSQKEFEGLLPVLKLQIKKDGIIWVSWYKKSSGKKTELRENMIRDTAIAIGLVDVKVCAIDDDWSALKLVYRIKDR